MKVKLKLPVFFRVGTAPEVEAGSIEFDGDPAEWNTSGLRTGLVAALRAAADRIEAGD